MSGIGQQQDAVKVPEIDPEMAPLMIGSGNPDAPSIRNSPPEMMRAIFAMIAPPGGPEMLEVSDTSLSGIPAREYLPVAAPQGTILYIHGGGWTIGAVSDYDHFTRTLAARTRCRVVSIDYRLAPEHRFPAAVDDCWAAINALRPTGPLFVGGDSAGGNLSAVMAQLARDAGGPAIAGQILIYPSVAGDPELPSMYEFVPPMLPREDIVAFFDHYIPDVSQRGDPRCAPIKGQLQDLPPAIVITAGADLLAAEGIDYADALEAAGNSVERHHRAGALHGYLTLLPETEAAKAGVAAIAAFVDAVLQA